jgi:hypothetical protein
MFEDESVSKENDGKNSSIGRTRTSTSSNMIEPCLCAQITVATPSASKFNGRQPDLVESQGNLEHFGRHSRSEAS